MASFSLGLNRALFPWRVAGLRTLLYDEETVAHLRSVCRSAPIKKATVSVAPQAVPSQAQGVSPKKAPIAPYIQPQATTQPSIESARAEAQTMSDASKNIPQIDSHICIVPPEQWPESWNECWNKLIRNAPKIIWTYPELIDDLTGKTLPEQKALRRSAFKKMFEDLALPQDKHHAFWPMAPLRKEEASPYTDADFFASAMERLRPEFIILLCDTTPESLHIPTLQPRLPIIHHGTRYYRLYNVTKFVADVLGSITQHRGLIRAIQNFFH